MSSSMHPALAEKHSGKSTDGSNLFATGRDLTVMWARSTGRMMTVNLCIFVLSVGIKSSSFFLNSN
jgi:hypothetical protein